MSYVKESIKNTERKFPIQGRRDYIRCDMNENIEGLPAWFIEEVKTKITPNFLSTYPEPDEFISEYSKYYHIDKSKIAITNGSDMGIRYIFEVFGEPNKEVLTVYPTFEMYDVYCNMFGYKHVTVSYKPDLSFDCNEIIDKINANTRIIVLLNPNSPIGNIYSCDDIVKILAKAKENDSIVIIDEAYYHYCNSTFISYIEQYDKLIILRTFSKIMGLAACRLGVIISNYELIQYIINAKPTFEVNSIALLFGTELLRKNYIIDELIKSERIGRNFLVNSLDKLNYTYKECFGNYILIKTKTNPKELSDRLKNDANILVHTYNNEILKDYIRVTTGPQNIMQLVITALELFDR